MSKEGKQIQFGRKLADSNKVVRDRAIKVVTRWLSKQKGISAEDLKKLWKGLFFCMWHSDKLEVQHELANRLGELMFCLPELEGILNYIRAFHWTILKEWHSIDKLRLDKFYSLIRCILKNSFQLLAKNAWDLSLAEKLSQILIDLPLNTSRKPEVVVSPGVAFHLADIYVEELEKSCKGVEAPITSDVINVLLNPFFRILAYSENDILVRRTQEGVFAKLLTEIEAMLTTPPEPDSMLLQVDLDSIAKTFFDLASSKDIVERHRKGLYTYKKKVETLDKKIDQMAAEAGSGEEDEEEESEEEDAENIIENEDNKKDKKRKRSSTDGNELGKDGEEEEDEEDEEELDSDEFESQLKEELMKEVLTLAAKYAGPKKQIEEEHVRKAMAELAAREAQENGEEDEEEDEEGAGEGEEGEEEDDDEDMEGMDFSGSSDEDLAPEDKAFMKKVMKEAFTLAGKEEVNEQHLRRAMAIVEAREHALQDKEGGEEEDSLDEDADAALEKELDKEEDDNEDDDDEDEEEESPVDSEEEELMQEIVKRAQKLAGPDGVVKEKHLKQAMDQLAEEDEAELKKEEKMKQSKGKGKGKAGKKASMEEEEEESDEGAVFDEEDEAEMDEMSEEKMMQEVMELAAKYAGGKEKIQKKHVKQAIETLSADFSSDEGDEELDMDDMGGDDDEELDDDDMDGDEDDEDMEDFSNFISSGEEDEEDEEDGEGGPEDAEGFQVDSDELEQDLDDDAIVQRAIKLAGGNPSKVEEKHIDEATAQLAQERAEEEEDDEDDDEGIFEEADGTDTDEEEEEEEEEEEIPQPKGKKGAQKVPEQPKQKAAAQPQKQQKQQQAQQQKPKAQPQKQQQAQQQKQQPKQQPQQKQQAQQQKQQPKKEQVKKEPAVAVKKGNKKQKVESAVPQPEQKGKKQQRRVSLDDALKAEIASGAADPVDSLDVKFSVPAAGKKGNKKTAAAAEKQAQAPVSTETKLLFKAPSLPQAKGGKKQQPEAAGTPQKKQSLKVTASPESQANNKRPDTPHPGTASKDAPKRVLGPVRFSLESAVKEKPKTEFSNTEIIGPVPVSSPDKRPEKGILKASPATTKRVTTTTTTTTTLKASVQAQEGAKKKRKRNRKKKPAQQ